ncbi:MAG TPA: endonuclease III [Syntrophales bacterium]|jgi:endonuclease-3|nr:endonuclease III [Syntrophales bacterium]HON23031.1 endonuclease III [Syntrophales bacterium]HOU78169.1 endonuclease III [Syntrophales bacterium]HPC33064.1 endonuclease III [Syntrophales bacterium]HQG34505.1 endonuclease III [Syntrophales bacterium]
MKDRDIGKVIQRLQETALESGLPIVSRMAEERFSPFALLVSTILSLRTKDEVTASATARLLELADTPGKMLNVPEETISRTIYPVGFYRNKARRLREISATLLEEFGGAVPDTLDGLLKLKGVGRKTANLVLSLGFDKDGICVDTHVHRISNRLGYVTTGTPEKTEAALRKKLPRRYWKIYNTILVAFGQKICRPVSPICSICPVRAWCDRIGVTRSR